MWVPPAMTERPEQMVLQAHKVPRVTMEPRVLMALQVHKVRVE